MCVSKLAREGAGGRRGRETVIDNKIERDRKTKKQRDRD